MFDWVQNTPPCIVPNAVLGYKVDKLSVELEISKSITDGFLVLYR